jgi:hypothetical protein
MKARNKRRVLEEQSRAKWGQRIVTPERDQARSLVGRVGVRIGGSEYLLLDAKCQEAFAWSSGRNCAKSGNPERRGQNIREMR